MESIIILGNGEHLDQKYLDRAQESVLLAIKKELPEEVFFQETIDLVLDKCKENLKYKKICL